MKHIKYFIFFVLILNCTSQKNQPIQSNILEFKLIENYIYLTGENRFQIVNNTNDNFIINKNGLIGKYKIYDYNKSEVIPNNIVYTSPAEWDNSECKKNIIIIPKHTKTIVGLYLGLDRFHYILDDKKAYDINFESEHSLLSSYFYGCNKYLDSLINKGHKIAVFKLADTKKLKF